MIPAFAKKQQHCCFPINVKQDQESPRPPMRDGAGFKATSQQGLVWNTAGTFAVH